ncbi:hypothetical protein J6590_048955 [Homalodisca vitripennis]|nr:hypothetical protein J6590_048955 [Homalodisca vitripennis]
MAESGSLNQRKSSNLTAGDAHVWCMTEMRFDPLQYPRMWRSLALGSGSLSKYRLSSGSSYIYYANSPDLRLFYFLEHTHGRSVFYRGRGLSSRFNLRANNTFKSMHTAALLPAVRSLDISLSYQTAGYQEYDRASGLAPIADSLQLTDGQLSTYSSLFFRSGQIAGSNNTKSVTRLQAVRNLDISLSYQTAGYQAYDCASGLARITDSLQLTDGQLSTDSSLFSALGEFKEVITLKMLLDCRLSKA